MGGSMSIVLQSSGGGSVTISEPSTASNLTATLPAATGTVMVSGNMPAFSAYAGATTSLGSATFTKVLFDTEEFDTNSNFASSRFTPTVAGYYQVTGSVAFAAPSTAVVIIQKTGAAYKWGQFMTSGVNQAIVTGLVYCNGSTDYVEIFAYVAVATTSTASQTQTYFQAAMVRSA